MKNTALLILIIIYVFMFAACGGDTADDTTPPAGDTSVTQDITEDTVKPDDTAALDRSLLFGVWKSTEGDVTVEITENEMKETDGASVTFEYEIRAEELKANGNYVCTVYANDSEMQYTVFKAEEGYEPYSYMEIKTNKATYSYSK